MLRDILLAVLYLALAGVLWALPKYLARRVTEAARGAVDLSVGKRLADYQHDLDLRLEGHRKALETQAEETRRLVLLDHEKFARDYSLFAEERNRAYAATYAQFEKTYGAFSRHFSVLTSHRDFSRSSEPDLREMLGRLELISAGEREQIKTLLDRGEVEAAGQLGTTLFEKDLLRQTNRSFYEFKNTGILNALYFSPSVSSLVEQIVNGLVPLSVYTDELIAEEDLTIQQRRDLADKLTQVRSLGTALRAQMRNEMQSSFARPAPPAV